MKNNRMVVHTQKAILNIRKTILKLRGKRRVVKGSEQRIVLSWIPSHVDIEGNKMADRVAKEATRQEHNKRIKVPYSDWKVINKEELTKQTRSRNKLKGKLKVKNFSRKFTTKTRRHHGLKKSRQTDIFLSPPSIGLERTTSM